MSDYISRADAIEAVCRTRCGDKAKGCPAHSCLVIEEIDALPSADAVPKWNCTASFVAEQLDRLREMTDEEKREFFKRFFEVEGGDDE